MKRRALLALAATALMATGLAGCTSFRPVYGDAAASGMEQARFNFAEPKSRMEQVILNRLKLAFPQSAGPQDPTLSVNASAEGPWTGLSNAIPVGRPSGTGVRATVTISQGGAELFSATRVTETTFQGGKLTPTNIFSAQGALDVAAQSTAESLRAAILAGYRPGQTPVPVSRPRH
jgi:hypothetical protein